MNTPLRIDERESGDVHVVALDGDLDLGTAPDLASRIDRARRDGMRRILVDMRRLDFCDSTGLRALVGAAREVGIAGGRLSIVCPGDGPVARVLDLSGLREVLHVSDEVGRATAYLQ